LYLHSLSIRSRHCAAAFGFNDEQRDKYLGGYIAAGFYIIGAPSALLFGYLCDRMNRRNLLVACILLGTLSFGNPKSMETALNFDLL
jgi:MFS family permease